MGRVVAADRALETGVPTEVVALHDGGREAGGTVDGRVRVDERAVHPVLVGRAREFDGEIHPVVEVERHHEIHPGRIIPDTETRCTTVIGEADDRVFRHVRAVRHHAPHIGTHAAVLGIAPPFRDVERGRERIPSTAGDGVLPPLGVVELALVPSRPAGQSIVTGDADAEDVIPSLVRSHVAEVVRIVAIRHPARRDGGEGRHHRRGLRRQRHGQASEAGQRGQKLSHAVCSCCQTNTSPMDVFELR